MGAVVNFSQVFDRHVRVDLSGVELLVAEQGLDTAKIGTAFQHQRRGCVPKHGATAALGDADRYQVVSLTNCESVTG